MKIPVLYQGVPVLVAEVDDRTGEVRVLEYEGQMGQRVLEFMAVPRECRFGENAFFVGDAFVGPAFLQQFLLQVWEVDRGLQAVMDLDAYYNLPETAAESKIFSGQEQE